MVGWSVGKLTETDTTVTRNSNIRPRQLLSCLYTTLNFLRTCVYCSLPAHLCLVRVGQVELALLAGSTVYSSLSSPLQINVITCHRNSQQPRTTPSFSRRVTVFSFLHPAIMPTQVAALSALS